MTEKLPFVLMVKPVGSRCNMRCTYCYYLDKDRFSEHEVQSLLSLELTEKMIRDAVAASTGPTVSFVWHGGEPTIAGIPYFRKALQFERRYLKPGQTAWNNLQTNGLLIDDEWAAFLARHHFDVGLSIDGSREVHDTNRRTIGSTETYEKAKQAVKTLQKYGIQPDLLCTVNQETVKDPLGVYRALRDLGTGWIQFIPIIVREGEGLSKESITADQYGDFLNTVFDEWASEDFGKSDVQLFAEAARVLAGQPASLCWMAETCGRVLIAEEDGSVYSCDHFVDDAHRLGNFGREDITELLETDEQRSFANAKRDTLTAQCRKCPYLKLCGGACPKDRFGFSEDGEPGQYILCKGLLKFFDHSVPRMQQMMKWVREGKSPEEVRKKIQSFT